MTYIMMAGMNERRLNCTRQGSDSFEGGEEEMGADCDSDVERSAMEAY